MPVDNFIHPFVEALSDKIVENLFEGAQWIHSIISNPTAEIKGIESISAAIQYYKDKQLRHDQPMQELLSLSAELERRAHRAPPQVSLK